MKTWMSGSVILLLCCLLGAQESKFSSASVAASEAQTKRILQEIHSLGSHDWAGQYYYGDRLGVNVELTLAPQNGFVFTWQGCLGLYDLNYGDVAFTQGTIRLLFRYPNKRGSFQGIAPELLPVHWGAASLSDSHRPEARVYECHQRRSAYFLLRQGDEDKPVEGLPDISSEYLGYILKTPVAARISTIIQIQVEKSRGITRVTLNAGSADGLRKGMEFFVKEPSRIYAEAVVTDVSDHWASAVIEQDQMSDPAPSPGWTLSTKL